MKVKKYIACTSKRKLFCGTNPRQKSFCKSVNLIKTCSSRRHIYPTLQIYNTTQYNSAEYKNYHLNLNRSLKQKTFLQSKTGVWYADNLNLLTRYATIIHVGNCCEKLDTNQSKLEFTIDFRFIDNMTIHKI